MEYLQISQVFTAAQWEIQLINDCSLHDYRSIVADYAFERIINDPENLVQDVRSVCSLLSQSSEIVNLDVLREFSDIVEGLCVVSAIGSER